MSNALRGEASFEVDGKVYKLRFSWNAAAEYEEAAGRPLSDALQDVGRGKMFAKSIRAMLWAGLQEHHPDLTLSATGELIDAMGRKEAQRVMGVALRYFFPEIGPAKTPPGPPGPAPSA